MAFDGASGVVNVGPSLSIDSTLAGSYSVEFWIHSTSTAVGRVLGKFNGPTGCNTTGPCLFTAILNVSVGRLSFYTGDGADANALVSTRSDLNDGAWHYIGLERDASTSPATQLMYIDGQLNSSRAESIAPASDSSSFHIGHDGSGYADYYAGDMAEVAIYPRVLSAVRVAAHYAAGSGGSLITLHVNGPTFPVGSIGLSGLGNVEPVFIGASLSFEGSVNEDVKLSNQIPRPTMHKSPVDAVSITSPFAKGATIKVELFPAGTLTGIPPVDSSIVTYSPSGIPWFNYSRPSSGPKIQGDTVVIDLGTLTRTLRLNLSQAFSIDLGGSGHLHGDI